MGVIIFNGKSSTDYGIVIEKRPPQNHGAKRGEAYTIAGRTGTFFREDGTYDNYIQPYEVAICQGMARRADLRAADVAGWLLGSSGFCRLEDSYNPGTFRLARFAGPMSFEADLRENGRTSLVFDCKPQRYTTAGETAITLFENVDMSNSASVIAAQATVSNLTQFPAKPILRVTGTGNIGFSSENLADPSTPMMIIELAMGDSEITVTIDCESYEIAGINTGSVSFDSSYPILTTLWPGNNLFAATYGITNPGTIKKLEIIPRWWTP